MRQTITPRSARRNPSPSRPALSPEQLWKETHLWLDEQTSTENRRRKLLGAEAIAALDTKINSAFDVLWSRDNYRWLRGGAHELLVLELHVRDQLLQGLEKRARGAKPEVLRHRARMSAVRFLLRAGDHDIVATVRERDAADPDLRFTSILRRRRPGSRNPKGAGRKIKHFLVYDLARYLEARYPRSTKAARHRVIATIASPFADRQLSADNVREILKEDRRRKKSRGVFSGVN